jgi:acyl-coenzyme A thioesterase PaaI-like protein
VGDSPEGHPAASVSDFGVSGLDPQEWNVRPRDDDPRYELSEVLRRLNRLVVGSVIDDEPLNAATKALDAIAGELEKAAAPGRRPRIHPDVKGTAQDFFPTSPVIGLANPIAPPVIIEKVDGGLDGRVFFDWQYEGPPGCVHGGVIALVFDELLGAANIAASSPGMTGTLTVRYRKPTPIRTELRAIARFEGREGRKIRTTGALYDGDELTAEAEGIFIELSPDRFFARIAREQAQNPGRADPHP